MREPPAATADMAARLPAAQDGAARGQGWSAPERLWDRGAKRIRSLYLPWMAGVTPKLSTKASPKGLASLSTINAAIMRLCRLVRLRRGRPPCHCSLIVPTLSREKPLPQRSSSQSLPLGEKDGQMRCLATASRA